MFIKKIHCFQFMKCKVTSIIVAYDPKDVEGVFVTDHKP